MHHRFPRVKPVYACARAVLALALRAALPRRHLEFFRRYPEGYQTLLDRGKSPCALEVAAERPNLGTFKSQLTAALKLADEKAAAAAISQAGFKQSTWWEDDKDRRDISREWRR